MRSACVQILDALENYTFWASPALAIRRAMREQRRRDLVELTDTQERLDTVLRLLGWQWF